MQEEKKVNERRSTLRTVKLIGLPPSLDSKKQIIKTFPIEIPCHARRRIRKQQRIAVLHVDYLAKQVEQEFQQKKTPFDANLMVVKNLLAHSNPVEIPKIVPSEFNIVSRGEMPGISYMNGKICLL